MATRASFAWQKCAIPLLVACISLVFPASTSAEPSPGSPLIAATATPARTTPAPALHYEEGAQVEEVLGLRLNQALIGELSSAQALNEAAREIMAIFERNVRKTGMLEPLPD